MIDLYDPNEAMTSVSYELTIVRSQASLSEKDLAYYEHSYPGAPVERSIRKGLPNVRAEMVREVSRRMSTFFTDLIVGKRHAETRTQKLPYRHSETVTIPFSGTVEAHPRHWWLTFGVLLASSAYLAATSSSFWDVLVATQVLMGAVQLWRWRVLPTPFSGSVSKEVVFEGTVEGTYEEVWHIDPLLDEKHDLRSDRITKVYVSPVPSTLPQGF